MKQKKISEKLPASLLWVGFFIAICCIAIFFIISWLLEYKDTIDGRVTITTAALPIDIHAKATGKLLLLKPNNALVKKGEHLAYIENTAALHSCLALLDCVKSTPLRQPLPLNLPKYFEPERTDLGTIQPSYIELLRRYQAYYFFMKNDRHQSIIQQKKEQIALQKRQITLANKKIELQKNNTQLAEKQLTIDKKLYAENIISKRELDQAQQAYNELDYAGRLIDFQTAISNAEIQIVQQKEAILQLKDDFLKEKERLSNAVMDAYRLMEKDMYDWQEQYLTIADIDGKLVYNEYLTDYDYIQKDRKMMTILPEKSQKYIGIVRVPMQGFSKIQPEQPVQIRLDNYPYQEFGILYGQVLELPTLPEDNHYFIKVGFPDNLRSSYNLDLRFNQRMEGEAAIITNRLSIWQKMRNQIKSARLND